MGKIGVKIEKTGFFVGPNHGHVVTKPKLHPNNRRAHLSNAKGVQHKRLSAVRAVVQEIAGFNPYERKIIEMLKTGDAKAEKKAVRMARRKLGQHKRARRKVDNLAAAIKAMRKK